MQLECEASIRRPWPFCWSLCGHALPPTAGKLARRVQGWALFPVGMGKCPLAEPLHSLKASRMSGLLKMGWEDNMSLRMRQRRGQWGRAVPAADTTPPGRAVPAADTPILHGEGFSG